MNYKAILFDLDGTLVDSVSIILGAFREVLEQIGIPFDAAAVRRHLGIPLREQAAVFAGDRAQEFIDRYIPIYRAYQDASVRLFPHTRETLAEVKRRGYLTAVVTSKSTRGASVALNNSGIADRFDAVVTAADVAKAKPHPEPILRALELLEVKPGQALFVGDSLFDVAAARAASVDMAAVSWGARSKEELLLECPDRVFDTWQELLDWLGAP